MECIPGSTVRQTSKTLNIVHIRPEASADTEEAAVWYENQRSGLGVEFVLEVDAAIERAAEFPYSYKPLYRDVRRVLLRRFYFIFKDSIVDVFAVLHQHRDPSTWQSKAG